MLAGSRVVGDLRMGCGIIAYRIRTGVPYFSATLLVSRRVSTGKTHVVSLVFFLVPHDVSNTLWWHVCGAPLHPISLYRRRVCIRFAGQWGVFIHFCLATPDRILEILLLRQKHKHPAGDSLQTAVFPPDDMGVELELEPESPPPSVAPSSHTENAFAMPDEEYRTYLRTYQSIGEGGVW